MATLEQLPASTGRPPTGLVCPGCAAPVLARDRFCRQCGNALPRAAKPRRTLARPGKRLVIAAIGAVAVVGAAFAAFFVFSRGEEEPNIGPTVAMPAAVTPDAKMVETLQRAAAGIPEKEFASDAEQVRFLIGPPDAFEISFDVSDGGRGQAIIRNETWYYFELESAFEFADGSLIGNVPADDVQPLAILPRQYDPSSFQADSTVEDVKKLLVARDALVRIDAPAELGVNLTAYFGEQLMVVFDDSGLILVKTFAIEGGGGEQ